MLKAIIFLTCCVVITTSSLIPSGTQVKQADKEYLTKQKAVLQLLHHVHQPSVFPELQQISGSYNVEQNINNYNNVETVKKFLELYKYGGLLGRRDVFSPLYKAHAYQAKTVFEVLYNAKDWDTFYQTAAWMRDRVNNGVFVYALCVAVIHRPDTNGIVLPPLYEVSPNFYIREETIQKAYEVRMQASSKPEGDAIIIPTNYTGWFRTSNPELRTSYFTEDVGLNSYHYFYHLTYPHWLPKEYCSIQNERKGELFYYVHQQILTRYKLERLANDMYRMKNFTFEEPNIVSYNPGLKYPNGKSFPARPEYLKLRNCDVVEIDQVKEFEQRIREAIDTGFVRTVEGKQVPLTTENGIDVLGRVIEKAAESVHPKYYGALYQLTLNLVGHIVDPYHTDNVPPSSLQHFQTMLRDPMYYRLFKRINKLFVAYKKTLPVYTKEKLNFPGVSIESIEVEKLMTYFENFDIDITNAVTVGKVEDDKVLKVVARQPRLNHKEFTYRISVNSNKDVVGMIRVYISPKYSPNGKEMNLSQKKALMVQIDRFPYQIKSGKTVIERNSKDFSVGVGDMTSFRLLYKQVEDALQGRSQFNINEKGHHYGFPSRLILPKGKRSGMHYTMFVVITPFSGQTETTETVRGVKSFVTCGGLGKCTDSYPLGFPFDREVVESEFKVPNIYQTDVTIYHKKIDETSH